jgi:hypothetical protein
MKLEIVETAAKGKITEKNAPLSQRKRKFPQVHRAKELTP